jgi:hypothetical protein
MMLMDWKMNELLSVRYKDGREDGIGKVARNALMNGFSIEQIQAITGLDTDKIRNLQETGFRHAS